MQATKLRYLLITVIIWLTFISGFFWFFFFFLLIRTSYYSNLESENNYIFDFWDFENDEMGLNARHMEFDIDDETTYTLMHAEFYLISNCRFFFDLYGGEQLLDYIDFIDFDIYKIKDKRNLKYIYIYINIFKEFWNMDSYDFYNLTKVYNNNYNEIWYLNKLEQKTEIHQSNINNIIYNTYNMDLLRKRFIYTYKELIYNKTNKFIKIKETIK